MSLHIREVLNRRTDLSTFVVHLTRTDGGVSARDRLHAILVEHRLRAVTPMGWAAEQDDPGNPAAQSQRVVCFSETPLEHIYSLVADIEHRRVQLEPYGVAFTKLTARRIGINPIWYVDKTQGQDDQWATAEAIDALKDAAIATGDFHNQPVAKLLPLFEQMGTWPNRQKEFWWEREWRHVGDVILPGLGCLYLSRRTKSRRSFRQSQANPSTSETDGCGPSLTLAGGWSRSSLISRASRPAT